MRKQPYLPKREPERIIWLNNFAAKIGGYAATFGITAAEVSAIQAMALLYAYIIGLIENSKTYVQNLTKFKDILDVAAAGAPLGTLPVLIAAPAPALTQSGIFSFISGIVMRIKGKTNVYTIAIGEDLGIIGGEIIFVADDYVPEATAKAMPGEVAISTKKKGVDGQNIYSHPVGGTDPNDWVKLAYYSSSPYKDTRPLAVPGVPEVREYKSRGVINDVEIGQWSAIISVTFGG